jgi:hypothetical protein
MSFDLHLKLTGLCALVPRDPITTVPPPPAPQVPVPLPLPLTIRAMRILLPDVRVERVMDGKRICPHRPVLRVEQPDGTMQEIEVAGDDIEIPTIDNSQLGVNLRPTFSLVADLTRARPDFVVDDALFSTPIGRNDIAARLRVTAARAFGVDPSVQTLAFATVPVYSGKFATAVRLEMRILDGAGEFRLTSFATGDVRTVSFGVKPDGSPVLAELSNLCPEATLVEKGVTPEDADFAAFYLLQADERGPFLVPKPVPRAREVLGVATSGVTCIGAVANANAGA